MFNIISNFSKLSYKSFVESARSYRASRKIVPGLNRRHARDANPGIQNRLNDLDPEDKLDVEREGNFNDDMESPESDFMGVKEMYSLHEQELKQRKQLIKLKMVRQKYFKTESGPNLLMWGEKEQIRHLHRSDSEKWSIEKLAQSFPATVETIKKVLKSKWHPSDMKRILKHDEGVKKNWQLISSGELEIDPELKQHLSQFTDRSLLNVDQVPDPEADERWRPRPARNEFGSIIESYKRLKSPDTATPSRTLEELQKNTMKPRGDTYVVPGQESYSQHGHITLNKYRLKVQDTLDKGHEASVETKLMLQSSAATAPQPHRPVAVEAVDLSYKASEPEIVDDSPDRITIPHKKWQRGATFKLGDSYYDDDGVFLYRVPGMK